MQLEWTKQHFVQFRHIKFAAEVRKQLMDLCRRNDVPVQSAANQDETVRKALATGLFTNVARLNRDGQYVTVRTKENQEELHVNRDCYIMYT